MNCDEAFDRMTVMGAAADEPLQRHLSHCRRCRAMQDTLSPAMDWLSSATIPPDGKYGSDPRQTVFLTDEAVQVAERAARRLSPVSTLARTKARLRNRVARAIAVIGMALLGLFAIITPSSTSERNRSATGNTPSTSQIASCLWKQRDMGQNAPRPSAEQLVSSCMACHFPLR